MKNTKHPETAQRLADLLTKNNTNMSELAVYVGVSPQAVKQWVDGSTAPKGANLKKAAEYLKTTEAHIQFGTPTATPHPDGAGHSNVAYIRQITVFDNLDELPDGSVLIPVIDAKLSAGHGRDNPHIDEREPLPFTGAFIKELRIKPKNAVMMKIEGESMQPNLWGGNSVLIDKGDTEPTMNGGAFALIVNGEWMLKRIYKRVGGGLIIKSDNPNGNFFNAEWDEETCEKAGVDIIGRVRYQSGPNGNF